MNGVKINFTVAAPVFDFSAPVSGFNGTVQNVMVNLGTRLGSDKLYSGRGTYLAEDAAQGRMVNLQWANNSANFAALRTLVFSQNTAAPGDPDGLQALTLAASVYNISNLNLRLSAVCIDGSTVGTAATL